MKPDKNGPPWSDVLYTHGVSDEPLEIIRANECEAPAGLATSRFRAMWNEIQRLRSTRSENAAPPASAMPQQTPYDDVLAGLKDILKGVDQGVDKQRRRGATHAVQSCIYYVEELKRRAPRSAARSSVIDECIAELDSEGMASLFSGRSQVRTVRMVLEHLKSRTA